MIKVSNAIDCCKSIESNSVQLAYIDPPYGSERKYKAAKGEFIDPKAEDVIKITKERLERLY